MEKTRINFRKNFILTTLFCTGLFYIQAQITLASSFSSTFSLNDEALDFANSSENLSGTNASMDLSSIFWTSRIMESASYQVIDSNSSLSSGVTPPSPGGGGGSGHIPLAEGEKDKAKLSTIKIEEKPELDLHEALEEEPADEEEPVAPEQPEVKTYADDRDGCSPRFENKFMKTNPYDYDSDNDEIGDCDEQMVYGLDDRTGLALFGDYIYTEDRPFLVGRADFGKNTY